MEVRREEDLAHLIDPVAAVLSLRDAAALLRLHPNTVRARAAEGTLPGVKVGRSWRFLSADLFAAIRAAYRAQVDPRPHAAVGGEGDLGKGVSASAAATERELDALLNAPHRR